MNTNSLQLWCGYPTDMVMREGVPECMPLLDDDEEDRLLAFRFDEHRQEFGTTRALVRTALSYNAPVQPANWKFRTNAWGKPEVDPPVGLQFNVSNCPGLVVCLIARSAEVGVDAEPFERANEILDLAEQVFSPAELAQLSALPTTEKAARALSLWTLKEAYTKARGMGFSISLRQFSFVFGGEHRIHLELDPEMDDVADRWRFCLLEQTKHQVAVVAECTTTPGLELWEVRPAHGTPQRLGMRTAEWFPAASSR